MSCKVRPSSSSALLLSPELSYGAMSQEVTPDAFKEGLPAPQAPAMYSKQYFWFQLKIEADEKRSYLYLSNSTLRHLELWSQLPDGSWEQKKRASLDTGFPLFELPANQAEKLLVHVRFGDNTLIDFYRVPEEDSLLTWLALHSKSTTLLLGLSLGTILFSTIFGVRFARREFFILCFYVGSVTSYAILSNGLVTTFDLPYGWNSAVVPNFIAAIIAGCVFPIHVLHLKEHLPNIEKVMNTIIFLCIVGVLLEWSNLFQAVILGHFSEICCVATLSLSAGSTFSLRKKAIPGIRTYLASWLIILFLVCIILGIQYGLKGSHNFTVGITINAGLGMYIILIILTASQSIDAERRRANLLLSQNEAIQRELRIVSSERLRMASRVAHRLNNPLNYIQLSVESLRDTLFSLQSFVFSLISDGDPSDPDVQSCRATLDRSFDEVKHSLDLLALGLQKSSQSVAEIRALSGVDGISKVHFLLHRIFPETFERLFELRPEYKDRLSEFTSNLDKNQRVFSNEYLICNALEIFLSEAFESTSDRINIVESLNQDRHWVVVVAGIRRYDASSEAALESRLTYIFKSIQLSSEFHWNLTHWSMRVYWKEV